MLKSTSKHLNFIVKRFEATKSKAVEAVDSPKQGHVYAKRPFKYNCKAGRAYNWCSCGWSRTQPFCDGTHKNQKMKIANKPLRFEVEETKDYWLCQCKQTSTRPFCDGTHVTEEVLESTSTIKFDI